MAHPRSQRLIRREAQCRSLTALRRCRLSEALGLMRKEAHPSKRNVARGEILTIPRRPSGAVHLWMRVFIHASGHYRLVEIPADASRFVP